MSMGTPIDGASGGGFRATRRGRAESSLATDKGGGWAEMVLGNAEGTERDMDWKASLARYAWLILRAALYHVLGSVSAGRPYGIVAIWF